MSSPIKLYDFRQAVVGLEAFVGAFEKKIQEIHSEIPVFILNSGDESYMFREKFEAIEHKEIYNKTPRIVFDIEELTLQSDQNTNQYIQGNYIFNDKMYEATFRRQATTVPISCNFVTSNFVKGLEYFTLLASVLSIDNVFTYDFLGNNHDGSYVATTYSFDKSPTDASSAQRTFVVKAQLELTLQLYFIRYQTIKEIDAHNNNELILQFNINTKEGDLNNLSILKTPKDECGCDT